MFQNLIKENTQQYNKQARANEEPKVEFSVIAIYGYDLMLHKIQEKKEEIKELMDISCWN